MANIESTHRKLVLKEASATVTFDKDSGKATLQRKFLFWNKKPVEFALSEIDDIAVKSDKDSLSGASIYHSVLHRRSGEILGARAYRARVNRPVHTALRRQPDLGARAFGRRRIPAD